MKYKYRFDPIAANEYEAAYSWYTERSQLPLKKQLMLFAQIPIDTGKATRN